MTRNVEHLPTSVERVTGDLTKPETLRAAFAAATALFLVTTDHGGGAQVQNAVAAAQTAGIKHIVYLSSLSAANPDTQIGRWHKEREDIVDASGIPRTFLRPGAFISNARQWLGSIKGRGAVFLPQPDKELHRIDPFDMAAVPPGTAAGCDFKAFRTVMPFIFKGILTGKAKGSPFFSADGKTPIKAPSILDSGERANHTQRA